MTICDCCNSEEARGVCWAQFLNPFYKKDDLLDRKYIFAEIRDLELCKSCLKEIGMSIRRCLVRKLKKRKKRK